ncbi:MAG: phospho-sugar mutase [Chlorobi bacterium]|nr:phospho-sugar mutase [Chlorobiota bacterium]
MNANIKDTVIQKANIWLNGNFDPETKIQVQKLIDENEEELTESFYKDLEFGTGGLRGIMGVGTNRMNIYTVGMATQGLCNYILNQFPNKAVSIAIAHDCRNNSRLFAETAAKIFTANNIKVYLFEDLRPTPELSFAIRHFGCKSGIVITASHNPKEYNGYKVYWEDGGQIIAPHDKNIIAEVQKIKSIAEVKYEGDEKQIQIIGDKIDKIYLEKISALSLNPKIINNQKNIKIVYTPIHGTGVKLVPAILHKIGFKNVFTVPEQMIVNGNFPTVHSPNPEEPAALKMAIEKAKKENADLVMATDPDADRVGIAVRNDKNKLILLNGNQTGTLLFYYLLNSWNEKGKLKGNEYIVKTIVTTELLIDIANKFGVKHYDVLTGFKYIADIMKQQEDKTTFIAGGEESYGYLAGNFVRDKDAVMACALIAETAAWAKENGKTLYELLIDIYLEFGFYKESLISIVKKGKSGSEEIKKIMDKFRKNPPQTLNNSEVVLIKDYQLSLAKSNSGQENKIDLPKSNVLQFITADGSKISIRPSGTEPKIKFYFGVKEDLNDKEDFELINSKLENKIKNIQKDLEIA